MSRIIKSTVAQSIEDNRKVISLKRVNQMDDASPEENRLIGNASIRRERIIEQATIEAERITREASEEIRREEERLLLDKERWITEREQLMKEAYDTGFLQGEEEGRKKGYQEYENKLHEANEITENNREQYEGYIQRAEKVIINLGIACAGKIINQKLKDEPDLFLSIVERGLKEVRDLPHIQIHVHPTRHKLLAENKSELEVMFPTDIQCFIYANDDLLPEECFIETNQGRVIVSVDSQLKELKLKLHHLLEGDVR
ncbi:flagellar assembly protein FliH [Rossellomorea sp. SC111]|uniref:flagellar assembly protein FliH n=1 Tax=Rossellomorea sp. SC111 TaxID=2968985 RepID=UPI00215B5660|nr:flagellar assembly protein FliH [Rossellomorea sp. SC111]MCR8848642.1 flagellar assembly protein FliH [Rossellomorea sp. SC111]